MDNITVLIILCVGFLASLVFSAGIAWLLGFRPNDQDPYNLSDNLVERDNEHNQQ